MLEIIRDDIAGDELVLPSRADLAAAKEILVSPGLLPEPPLFADKENLAPFVTTIEPAVRSTDAVEQVCVFNEVTSGQRVFEE